MAIEITIQGKPLQVEISAAASEALQQLKQPLVAEMELYFSCLIRKKVRFYGENAALDSESVPVNEQLAVRFRPVMTQSCSVDATGDEGPPVTDFPIANPSAYVPHWLRLDFRRGEWRGEFGYH
jgi:hypothetical protein